MTPMTEAETHNPAFSWVIEGGQIFCSHDSHSDLTEGWLMEPCEHCGADITGADFYPPEWEDLTDGYRLLSVPLSAGTYVFHPCGHTMRNFTMWKDD